MTEVKSPMAGTVWQVVCAIGDQVSEGDELIILEAMKMEIPIEATASGTVTAIAVAKEALVAEGDVLVVLG